MPSGSGVSTVRSPRTWGMVSSITLAVAPRFSSARAVSLSPLAMPSSSISVEM